MSVDAISQLCSDEDVARWSGKSEVMEMVIDVDVMMMNSDTDQSERAKNEALQGGRRPPSVDFLPPSLCVYASRQWAALPVARKAPTWQVVRPPSIND
jgi:hypothetical protein